MANGFVGWSGAWNERDWKIRVKEIKQRAIWIELWEQAQYVKFFVHKSGSNNSRKITENSCRQDSLEESLCEN